MAGQTHTSKVSEKCCRLEAVCHTAEIFPIHFNYLVFYKHGLYSLAKEKPGFWMFHCHLKIVLCLRVWECLRPSPWSLQGFWNTCLRSWSTAENNYGKQPSPLERHLVQLANAWLFIDMAWKLEQTPLLRSPLKPLPHLIPEPRSQWFTFPQQGAWVMLAHSETTSPFPASSVVKSPSTSGNTRCQPPLGSTVLGECGALGAPGLAFWRFRLREECLPLPYGEPGVPSPQLSNHDPHHSSFFSHFGLIQLCGFFFSKMPLFPGRNGTFPFSRNLLVWYIHSVQFLG